MLVSANHNSYLLRQPAPINPLANLQFRHAGLVSASCQSPLPRLLLQNTRVPAFGKELTLRQSNEIYRKLSIMDAKIDKTQEKLCGKIKLNINTGGHECLNVYSSIKRDNFFDITKHIYTIRKNDEKRSLLGYTGYYIDGHYRSIKALYNTSNDSTKYIHGEFMLAGGQNEYKNIGKALHQLRIEKSILKGCPGYVFIQSETQFHDLCPTGFHYKCGFVPYNYDFDDFTQCKRDRKNENTIKDELRENNYTDLDRITMYLPPENFAKWKQEIREKPILDETKQLIAEGRF